MVEITVPLVVSALVAVAVVFAVAWRHLPTDGRQPLAVYVVSYVVTYVAGALWIGFTDGDALVSYFRGRLYVPQVEWIGPAFWVVLLAPLVIPVAIMPLFFRA